MTASSHVTIGFISWAGVEVALGSDLSEPNVLYFFLAMLGSLLPDIDHPKSWLGGRLLFISFPLWAVFGHRGITHSLLAIAALSLVVYFYQSELTGAELGWLLPLIVGYLSHLLADYFTNSGIPLFYPVRKRVRFPLTVETGSFAEYLIVYSLSFSFAFMLYQYYINI